jgi:hypothetical protein
MSFTYLPMQKKLSFLLIVFCSILFFSSVGVATNCSTGEDYVFDFYDSDSGIWIDTPNKYCIRGTFGNETCTADYQCDPYLATDDPYDNSTWGNDNPYTANTFFCNAGVHTGTCNATCKYELGDNLCNSDFCIADPECNDVADGTYFADPTGDGTRDYCTSFFCVYQDNDVCDSAYGASTECDGQTKNIVLDFDTDGDVDLCNDTCSFLDCVNDNSSMCQSDEECIGTTCVVPASDELFLQIEYDASGTNRLSENMSYGTENTYVLGVASQDRNSTTDEMQDYNPSMKVPLEGEPILLFFASAEDLESIEAKEEYINTRDFFNLKNPTFSDVSYDDTFYTPIAHLIYRDIVLNGSVNLYSGTHTLFIEKSGTDATGLPIVSVRTG